MLAHLEAHVKSEEISKFWAQQTQSYKELYKSLKNRRFHCHHFSYLFFISLIILFVKLLEKADPTFVVIPFYWFSFLLTPICLHILRLSHCCDTRCTWSRRHDIWQNLFRPIITVTAKMFSRSTAVSSLRSNPENSSSNACSFAAHTAMMT